MKTKQLLKMAFLGLMAAVTLTSCEGTLDDIFGEWDKPTPADTSQKFDPLVTPLTLEAVSGDITVTVQTPLVSGKTIEYSIDNGVTWTSATATGDGNPMGFIDVITITGKKVMFRGNNDSYFHVYMRSNADCYIYGNVMSLIYGDNYIGKTTLDKVNNKNAFRYLFSHNPYFKNHESKELVLPATQLAPGCYQEMFLECTGLTKAPALPATDLTGCDECYMDMFEGCKDLTEAPELPATKLSIHCYSGMLKYCDKLKTAPALPATDLSGCDYCYSHMFFDCDELIDAPELPATKLAKECYYSMFCACPKLETAPNLPSTQLADGCYNTMFSSCTNLKNIPEELPATILADGCYDHMYAHCTKLTKTPILPATNLDKSHCYSTMFEGCTSLSTVICKATSITGTSATANWLDGVSSTGTFKKAASMTSWTTNSASGIPSGWTIEDL